MTELDKAIEEMERVANDLSRHRCTHAFATKKALAALRKAVERMDDYANVTSTRELPDDYAAILKVLKGEK